MMPLIQQLIKKQTQDWTPQMIIDPVQDRLLDIIRRRRSRSPCRTRQSPPAAPAPPSNVVNIMDALTKSVAAENRSGK
jgi:DNA end-binding protein Ku